MLIGKIILIFLIRKKFKKILKNVILIKKIFEKIKDQKIKDKLKN
jgi:hypothetical protein